MSSNIVLCRRDLAEIGEPKQFCSKAISNHNRLNWCNDCLKTLPLWPPDGERWAKVGDSCRLCRSVPLVMSPGGIACPSCESSQFDVKKDA